MVNDTMPMERILISSIKSSKIKSIVIQHGIFSAAAHKAAADGFYSDYIFCISKSQKGIIESKGISSSKVIEMGFGNNVYKPKRSGVLNSKKICFLGQQWAQVDNLLFEKYITIVRDLRDIANSLGVDFIYKTHPAENNFNFINEKYLARCTLEQAIDNYDFFFSINSTALLEVSRSGLVAVQLFDELFSIDLLDTEGYVKVLKISKLSKIGLQNEILKIIGSEVKIERVKETPLVERFFASIKSISNK